jgi:radical SAM protein with 4Fe4S-binding SPASM domain
MAVQHYTPAPKRVLLPVVDRRIAAQPNTQSSCYFRSGPPDGYRKALIKITDRCELRCAHCFVSAGRFGNDMPVDAFDDDVLARLAAARVTNVTLTGGEPFVHPQLTDIAARLIQADTDVTICTNGADINQADIDRISALRRVRVNVSLDGFSATSHGRFRGDRGSFQRTVDNMRLFSAAGLLKGVLCTPNALAHPDEYGRLAAFASELGAEYLLMNPLSSFGRGIKSRAALAADDHTMAQIQQSLAGAASLGLDVTYIRFPGQPEPLDGCIAGDIFYVFVNGDVAVCPYLVFATANPHSKHQAHEFIVGNIFKDNDLDDRLRDYRLADRYPTGQNPTCSTCAYEKGCGKGCPAAVIANGGRIGDVDADVCPIAPGAGSAPCS